MQPIHPKSHRLFVWTMAIALAFFVVVWFLLNQFNVFSSIKQIEVTTNNFIVQNLRKDSLTPPPLRGVLSDTREPLTVEGVLDWTNKNRQEDGKQNLTINAKLTEMAEQKLVDLFAKQYFEHESPTGVGPSDLAKQDGYEYIVIGENLALGNFNGDKALVDAWMASPGHRANILNSRYREIGIAVQQGVFEGKNTWIAVQEFGLPVDACPQPSRADKIAIDKIKAEVDALEKTLAKQKAVVDGISLKYGDEYNAKVTEYNVTVKKLNNLVTKLKNTITAYNKQVAAFNACAEVKKTP